MPIDIAALTSDLVAIPTHEGEGRLQTFLADVLTRVGFDCRLEEVLPGRPNLLASRGAGGPLLCSHADIFPPYGHLDPFTVRREGDELVGRGVVDTKGQIAALAAGVEASSGPCEIAITVDEERLGRGSLALMTRASAAIVLEPTDLAVCPVQAGFLECDVVFSGRPAHGTVPNSGRSAIHAAFDCYEAIRCLPFMKRHHELLGLPWSTLGTIAGGLEVGTVAPSCRIQFDLGIWPELDLDLVESMVRDYAGRFGGILTVVDRSSGYELPSDHSLVVQLLAAAERARVSPRLGRMPSWTDAQNLMLKGIPAVVFGAGELAAAHSDREWVRLSDLENVARTLAALVDGWAEPTKF